MAQPFGVRAVLLGAVLLALVGAIPTQANPSPSEVISPSTAVSTTPQHEHCDKTRTHLNTATRRQLRKLPGIGELLAQRIIAARPFHTVEDLRKIKGISEKHFQQLKKLVCV